MARQHSSRNSVDEHVVNDGLSSDLDSFLYSLNYYDHFNQANQMNPNQELVDDVLDFNAIMNNFGDDDDGLDGLQRQLNFNQIMSKLVESYKKMDESYSNNRNVSIQSLNQSGCSNEYEEGEIVFIEEKNTQNTNNKPNHIQSVIEINDEENANKSKNSVDDDVCFLYEEAPKQLNAATNYYDNDSKVDEKEVLKRWRLKKLSDPKINLSKTNYRLRCFNDKNAKQPTNRKFKSCIFEGSYKRSPAEKPVDAIPTKATHTPALNVLSFDKNQIERLTDNIYIDFNLPINNARNPSKSNQSIENVQTSAEALGQLNNQKSVRLLESKEHEENILNKKIDDIKKRFKEINREAYSRFNGQKESLNQVYAQYESMMHSIFQQQKFHCSYNDFEYYLREYNQKRAACKSVYYQALNQIKFNFKNECKNLSISETNQINNLRLLFESGKYEKGKLDQYCTVTMMQPSAKRRRYNDDGRRQVLLPEEKIRNIIIEDTIYSYYYGEPK